MSPNDLALNIVLAVLGVALVVLFVLMCCCTNACGPPPPRGTQSHLFAIDMMDTHGLNQALLTRDNLATTILAEGEAEWQCIVCLHMNHPATEHCPLCGAAQDISVMTRTALLADTTIMGNTVMGATFLSNYGDDSGGMGRGGGGGGTGGGGNATGMSTSMINGGGHGAMLALDKTLLLDISIETRQRALRYRRLNRMQLTQRQRSAQRRRLWQRVQLPHGSGFIWVRTALPSARNARESQSLVTRLRLYAERWRRPTEDSEEELIAGMTPRTRTRHELSATLTEQLHRKNAATLGFYSELDEHTGDVQWKSTTDAASVAIAIDTSEAMMHPWHTPMLGDDAPDSTAWLAMELDLEGLMALPFKMKKRWFLKKLNALAIPYTEAMFRIVVRRDHVLEDSVSSLTAGLHTESHHLATMEEQEQLRQHLSIAFDGEPALDAGGVLREWFALTCQALFNQELGLFTVTQGELSSYWLNPMAAELLGGDHLRYYRFAGRLLGRAMLEGLVLDVHLALPLLKHILGVPITFSDLEFLDQELYQSCVWMREHDGVEHLCVTFSVQRRTTTTSPSLGGDANAEEDDVVDLKPGGRDIDVTDENKEEYLALLLRYRMLDSVAPALTAMLQGLYEVIPRAVLAVFDYQELDFFLCGLPEINVSDWELNSRVRPLAGMLLSSTSTVTTSTDAVSQRDGGGPSGRADSTTASASSSASTPRGGTTTAAPTNSVTRQTNPMQLSSSRNAAAVAAIATNNRASLAASERDLQFKEAREQEVVRWFWEVVRAFSDEERARLLQFASGASRVPVEGFRALTSASGFVHPFTLQLVPRGVPPAGLCPRAHTCFNRIDLPMYESREELETYLSLVIQMEITGFGFE